MQHLYLLQNARLRKGLVSILRSACDATFPCSAERCAASNSGRKGTRAKEQQWRARCERNLIICCSVGKNNVERRRFRVVILRLRTSATGDLKMV
jgi:hypothetical protein